MAPRRAPRAELRLHVGRPRLWRGKAHLHLRLHVHLQMHLRLNVHLRLHVGRLTLRRGKVHPWLARICALEATIFGAGG